MRMPGPETATDWRDHLHEIIFEADTRAGKAFDVALLWAILMSVLAVMLDSVSAIREAYGSQLRLIEWFFTFLFTIEYGLRLVSVRHPGQYARSFFGIVDLLAILPTYLSLAVAGTQSLLVIRTLRLLRVFRVFKLARYVVEADTLLKALRASRVKILVFLWSVLSIVIVIGALMYLIEGEVHGFTSIPISIYWAVVTMTTVGYGDIAPETVYGQILASVLMIVGYAIIAIPTGIVSVELANASRIEVSTQACPACSKEGHDMDARYCKHCGEHL